MMLMMMVVMRLIAAVIMAVVVVMMGVIMVIVMMLGRVPERMSNPSRDPGDAFTHCAGLCLPRRVIRSRHHDATRVDKDDAQRCVAPRSRDYGIREPFRSAHAVQFTRCRGIGRSDEHDPVI